MNKQVPTLYPRPPVLTSLEAEPVVPSPLRGSHMLNAGPTDCDMPHRASCRILVLVDAPRKEGSVVDFFLKLTYSFNLNELVDDNIL